VHRSAHAHREAERTEEHADRDTRDDASRRAVAEVVDEESEQRAADDAADEQAAETEQIATPEGRGLKIVWHRPKLSQAAAPGTGREAPGKESRIAVVNIGGRSVSKGGRRAGRSVPSERS
jgi:hypothetical protein